MNEKQLQRGRELEQDINKAREAVDTLNKFSLANPNTVTVTLSRSGYNTTVFLGAEDFDLEDLLSVVSDKAAKKLAALEREFKAL